MPRRLRHVEPGRVYHLTHRTRGGRYAFVPTPELNAELIGVIGEAQSRWPQVKVHQMVWLSNHVTGQLSVEAPYAANAMGAWASYVFGEAAKVAKAIHGLEGEIWEKKRYRLAPIREDSRLLDLAKYTMAQAPAAGLVARPHHWPGINTCDAVCRGARIVGYRGNADLRRQARAEGVPMGSIAPKREIKISPYPTHAEQSVHARQTWFRTLEREIVEETAAANPGRAYRSAEYFRSVSPHTTKALTERPAPSCYVAEGDHEARRTWRTMMRAFTAAWREALAEWIDGVRVCFPRCGWVPYGACYAPAYSQRE